ncbi:hypothetical protein EW146_g2440 [Bondarzewia mesenterica]|uniref:Uncharacterized protein n=1 Tax=Bondarzewia mesenterica TaxID=1095465 RepID=A0A4S4M0L0_9AGAM|nr:hypothetical protein EW146_g2440 [Bondarzewia mesenterica]
MVNWTDASELARDADAFNKVNVAFFGLYIWELFQTSDFEWSLFTGRRKFKWPLSCLLLSVPLLPSVVIDWDNHIVLRAIAAPILYAAESLTYFLPLPSIQALYTFNSIVGHLAVITASTCLMIKTWELWGNNWAVVAPLGVMALAHWGLIWRGMFLIHASWESDSIACVVTSVNANFLTVTFFYTMAFDFIIFSVACFKLFWDSNERGFNIWNLLFRDGLIFFFITFACNILPAVFDLLNLNPIMNVISTVPSGTMASVAACRVFIQADKARQDDTYTHQAAVIGTVGGGGRRGVHPRQSVFPPEVRVKTEQIVMDDYSSPSTANTPYEISRRSVESGKSSDEGAKVDRGHVL